MPTLHLKKSAFTLIELLITMSILAIMSAMVFPGLNNFAENQRVQQQTLNVVSDIELVKNKALAGAYTTGSTPTAANWAIGFCLNSETGRSDDRSAYILFPTNTDGSDFGAGSPAVGGSDIVTRKFDGGVQIANCTCSLAVPIWSFKRLTGAIQNTTTTCDVTLASGSISRTISVNAEGRVNIN